MNSHEKAMAVCREIVRLNDAGIRPQVTAGSHREETDWQAAVASAAAILNAEGTK